MAVVFKLLPFTHAGYRNHPTFYLRPSQPIARRQHVARDRALCCLRRFEKRKGLVILSLSKPRFSAEAIWKTYSLFICADSGFIANLFCKKCSKNDNIRAPILNFNFCITLLLLIYFYFTSCMYKHACTITRLIMCILFIYI